jgi:putative tryptophan/tyrosine transport system substrate-binding protein
LAVRYAVVQAGWVARMQVDRISRRRFVRLLGGATASASPVPAIAQQPGRTYRLGFLIPVARYAPALIAFLDELRAHGFVEGQNLEILPGGFEVRNEQIADLVPVLVKAAPDTIISGGDFSTRALQNATKTIPIVVITEDVVGAGFAASLARPGGNITGISLMSTDLDGKRQDVLVEAVPSVRRFAALADSNVATLRHLQRLEEVARMHGKELLIIQTAKAEEVVPAINGASAKGVGALNVLASPMLFLNRHHLAPNFNGHRYQNYPERGAKNYRWMYWGDAFPTLLFLKKKYDPDGFFRFEQDISPYPDGDGITRSAAASRFTDMTISG